MSPLAFRLSRCRLISHMQTPKTMKQANIAILITRSTASMCSAPSGFIRLVGNNAPGQRPRAAGVQPDTNPPSRGSLGRDGCRGFSLGLQGEKMIRKHHAQGYKRKKTQDHAPKLQPLVVAHYGPDRCDCNDSSGRQPEMQPGLSRAARHIVHFIEPEPE